MPYESHFRARARLPVVALTALLSSCAAMNGCATPVRDTPATPNASLSVVSDAARNDGSVAPIAFPADRYADAFDAAEEAARGYGLIPALRDRRAGVIETDAALAGSLLEPWDRATRTLGQALENTLALQRRRARFEFRPAQPTPSELENETIGLGPGEPLRDLTEETGPLELHVFVYLERAHVPGIRRSAWSRRLTTQTDLRDPVTGRGLSPSWTVVARDPVLENRLVTDISKRMSR